jgi:hypothetical protein
MRLFNQTRSQCIAAHVQEAATFFSRTRGLLGRSHLAQDEALLIRPCNAVHTFGMRFAIDVLWVSSSHALVGVCPDMPPWRISRIYWNAHYVIELSAGTISRTDTRIGDTLALLQ